MGRKKKNISEVTAEESTQAPKKRGRPKKQINFSEEKNTEKIKRIFINKKENRSPELLSVGTIKGKQGRKKKEPLAPQSVQVCSNGDISNEQQLLPIMSTVTSGDESVTEKKKRGRPKKNKDNNEIIKAQAVSVIQEFALPVEQSPLVVSGGEKKKRGRPKKNSLLAPPVSTDVVVSSGEESLPVELPLGSMPKRRGRPKKCFVDEHGNVIERAVTEKAKVKRKYVKRQDKELGGFDPMNPPKTLNLKKDIYKKTKKFLEESKNDPNRFAHLVNEETNEQDAAEERASSIEAILKKNEEFFKDKTFRYPASMELHSLIAHFPNQELPDFMLEAFLNISPEQQRRLILRFGRFIFLVNKSMFIKSMQIIAKNTGVDVIKEEHLFLLLEDILKATYEYSQRWVFQDQVGQIANIMTNIMHAKGDCTTLDKIEFAAILSSISLKIFITYLNQGYKEHLFKKTHAKIDKSSLLALAKNGHSLFDTVCQLIDVGVFQALANKQRELHGDIHLSADTTRATVNLINVATAMINMEDTVRFYNKKMADKIEGLKKDLAKIEKEIESEEQKDGIAEKEI